MFEFEVDPYMEWLIKVIYMKWGNSNKSLNSVS